MKRIFASIVALAAAFATSCQNDVEVGAPVGETSTVTFCVGTPEIETRAYSDGMSATVLKYAVYDAAGQELTDLTVTDGEIHGSTTVNLQLTTGKKYSVIFWAEAEDAPYTVDLTNKTMTVDYTAPVCNDEARDAFYKYHEFTVTGAQTETIELKRPFAQLNIGTNDFDASAAAGYTPTKSTVYVSNVYTTLDLVEGKVSGATEVTYAEAAIPEGEEFPVAGYDYLAMNYLLVDAEKELVDIEFTYTDGADAKTRTVGSVPVQRNHRTNIYGQLLTGNVIFNVVIEPDYNEPAHEADPLLLAAAVGGEVTLTEDVELTETLNFEANVVLDLDGHTLSADFIHQTATLINNAQLTIKNGTIAATGNNGGSAIRNNGTIILDNVTLNGAPFYAPDEYEPGKNWWPSYTVNNTGVMVFNNSTITSDHGAVASYGEGAVVTLNNTDIIMDGIAGMTSHALYTYDNGQIIVNGGNIANNAADQSSTGGSVINGNVTVNAGVFSGRINSYYATPVLKGGSYTVNPEAYVAEGCKVVEKDGLYYVVEDVVDVVATTPSDFNALEEGSNVVITEDLTISANDTTAGSDYGSTGIEIDNGAVFDANGNTLSVTDANGTWDCAVTLKNGTLKNAVVRDAFRGVFMGSASGDVYIDNVVLDYVCYAFNSDGGNKEYGVYISNTTLNGWTSFSDVHKEVVFTNCNFGKGSGGYAYAFCRPYAPTVFENCEFAEGFKFDASNQSSIVFKNCTYGGVKITAENAATLASGDVVFFYNGVGSVTFE